MLIIMVSYQLVANTAEALLSAAPQDGAVNGKYLYSAGMQ